MSRKNEYKSYAREISKELGIEYYECLKMSIEDVEKISQKKFAKKVEETMNNEARNKKLRCLWPYYKVMHDRLGDDLIRAYAYYDEAWLFEWSYQGCSHYSQIDYTRSEMKEFVKDDGYYSKKYLVARGLGHSFDEMMEDAIIMHYPELTEYAPKISSSEVLGNEPSITFKIIRNEEQEGFYSEKYCEDMQMTSFECSVFSFISMDWDSMFEDCLELYGLYKCKNKEDKKYKKVNSFMNSPEMARFKSIIEKIIVKEKETETETDAGN